MDADLKEKLNEIEAISKDNNRMLLKLRRAVWWTQFFSVFRWVVIIGLAIGAFYIFQPFFDKISEIYQYTTGYHLPDFGSVFGK